MGRLDDITLQELYELKDQIDEGKPQERVLAVNGRKQGDQLDTLADRHGVVENMIRNWLDRFEEEPIEQAPYDVPRPGRPAKIEGEDREQLFEQLQQPLTELGYDQQAWSAKLLLHHAKEEYDVEYHETYAYDLLKEAGLSLRKARPRHHKADPEEKGLKLTRSGGFLSGSNRSASSELIATIRNLPASSTIYAGSRTSLNCCLCNMK